MSSKTRCLWLVFYVDRYSYGEPIPYRFSNDAYIAKLLVPLHSVADTIRSLAFYTEPKRFTGTYANAKQCTKLTTKRTDCLTLCLGTLCGIRPSLVPLDHQLTVKFQCGPRGNSEVFSPGRGNLACVHYSGSKAFSNRRPLYKNLSIRDDVNLLSFYAKNRLAAAGLAVENATGTASKSQR